MDYIIRRVHFIFLIFGSIGVTWVGGCKTQERNYKLADVDGQSISVQDLDKAGGRELRRQREALYKIEQKSLDEYINALLLTREAKRRGVPVATLLDQEVNSRVAAVSDEQVAEFYASRKEQLGVDFDKIKEKIREHLSEERIQAQKSSYFRSLRAKSNVVTYLRRPPEFRSDVQITGAPFKGTENARVTIVKFEDFQCPYCKAIQPVLVELLKRYDGKLRLVHKDLPLDAIHPQARQAAEAARCAADEARFWEYHDKLYSHSPKLSVNELKVYARDLGLKRFDQCFTSEKFKGAIQQDVAEGANLGLTGTPSFFINGREISGAQPIEAFIALIDDELAQSN
jgi:predicted DsbA family dithiol-disulfide isomerase